MKSTTTATATATPPRHEALLSTVSRLSNDPNAVDEHHLASLAILSRMTSSSLSPPEPREVEEALGPRGLNFLTRLIATYTSTVRRGEQEDRRLRAGRGSSSTTKGNAHVVERVGGAVAAPGWGRVDPPALSDSDAYLSLAVSVASYLASESPPASAAAASSGGRDGNGERYRVLPAVFNARLMSRLIDALLIRAEMRIPVEHVEVRILSVFTGATLHLLDATEKKVGARAGTEEEGDAEEVAALLARCAEAAVARCRRANSEGVGGADLRAYSEGLASFLRSLILLTRMRWRRGGLTRRSPNSSPSRTNPLLLPPTSTLLDLLETSSSRGGCCVDLREIALLWTTETLTQEVAADGRRTGDVGARLVDLLRGCDRRASTALRRSILLGTMGMTVRSDNPASKELHLATDGEIGDGRMDDAKAAVRLRNTSYGTLAVAMESCGGRWLLDDLDPSSSVANDGCHRGSQSSSVGRSLTALVRMACGELRIVLEGAAATASTSPSPSSVSPPAEAEGSGRGEREVSSLDVEVASHCVRVIVATVELLVEASSVVEEEGEGDNGGPISSTTASPRPKADWEELLASHDGINSLLEIRGSLNAALGVCLAFLASTPTRTRTRPHHSGGWVEGSFIPQKLGEGRELLGLLCCRCVGAFLAEMEVEDALVAVAASSSDAGGEDGAAAVVADALRNAVVLCYERGGGREDEEDFPAAGGTTAVEKKEEESATETASSTVADGVEPLALLLPSLAKILAPEGDVDACATVCSPTSSSPSSLVAERLVARDRVVVECVASYVRRVSSSFLHPPDGGEADAMDTEVEAERRGGDAGVISAAVAPHAGLRWALLVLERWWWWHRHRLRHRRGYGGHRGRTSAGSTSFPSGHDDFGDGDGEEALPLLLLGAVAECAGALTDRVQMRPLARARSGAAEGLAESDDGNDDAEEEEREHRITLCVAIQTWFSILEDDVENGTIRLDGPMEEDGGVLRRGGFQKETSLAVVARAMETTFAVPVPCADATPDDDALAPEVARTAATVISSMSGRSGFDRIVGLSGLDGASIEALWRAVGWWSHRVRE